MRAEFLAVRAQVERAAGIALHDRVQAVLAFLFPGLELLAGHVLGVEARAGRARAMALKERLVCRKPVPGTEVVLCETPRGGVLDTGQQAVAVAPHLQPEEVFGDLRGVDEQPDHFTLGVAEVREVGAQAHRCIDIESRRSGGRGFRARFNGLGGVRNDIGAGIGFLAAPLQQQGQRQDCQQLFHVRRFLGKRGAHYSKWPLVNA